MPIASPLDIGGVGAWFDLDDVSTLTDAGSGRCSQANDKSGNSNHMLQGTNSKRPTITVDALTGRTCLSFSGSNVMEIAHASTISFSAAMSWAAILNITSFSSFGYLFSKDTTNSSTYAAQTNTSGQDLKTTINTNIPTVHKSGDPSGRHIPMFTHDGANRTAYWDGVQNATAAYASGIVTNSLSLWVGAARTQADFSFTGTIQEIVWFNKGLSNGERDDLYAYLLAKSLPKVQAPVMAPTVAVHRSSRW